MDRGISDWGQKSPKEYLDRFAELLIEAHEQATTRTVEQALLATDGPLAEVIWFALEDYDEHVVIYRGDDHDQTELRRLHSFRPSEQQMPQLKAYFQNQYTLRPIEKARVIEIPDTYNPHLGRNPGVKLGAHYDPEADQIKVGIKAKPLQHNDRIVEDVNRLVPADDVEDFINRIDYELGEELLEEANQRLLEGAIEESLAADPDFRHETTTSIPTGTHPEYDGREADLWQKPVSKLEYIDSSQGFLQVWLPADQSEVGVVTTTAGDYEERRVIEAFCERFEERAVA